MLTGKQERNGVPGPPATRNTAVPGPDATPVIAAAVSAVTSSVPPITVSQGVADWATGIAGDA